ncbi:tandem C2 domains nuclear protein [Denticeps clupeoides]|uniref:C2 domain-containing protein n=1 Tax=Denticeps clupeoides TaxID=299321 RepID=A0AAY4DT83_9TELE|nr:tandem C2 domains nuclear protein [Denticeps clupeoides]
MAAECIKKCCSIFLSKGKQHESQGSEVVKVNTVPPAAVVQRKSVGVSEDYLLSKLPPDGKEVPFVLPTFKPSYVQPRAAQYSNYQIGSARSMYADRKAELSGTSSIVYNPDTIFHTANVLGQASPGSQRQMKSKVHGLSPAWDSKSGKQRLSNSMLDLSSPQHPHLIQRYDSMSSVPSSSSSMRDSTGSSRSLESITLSGDERDWGKLCVRLSYQEALEQVWITLEQCKDIPVESSEQQRVGIKGTITLNRPVQFKSTIKEGSPDMVFMETFVFALQLHALLDSALVLRLQTHTPRKRTVADCVLSLRHLSSEEKTHWLTFHPPSKSRKCHAELNLATCFQPVSGRIQLQVISAQNLPSSSSPLSQNFFVKAEMYSLGLLVAKMKTRALRYSGGPMQWGETLQFPLPTQDTTFHILAKLFSRSSVRRKHFLGQVHLGFSSPSPEAAEQWRETIAQPEKVVAAWHKVTGP